MLANYSNHIRQISFELYAYYQTTKVVSYFISKTSIILFSIEHVLDLEFNENTMVTACGVLKKFDAFLCNCYNHLNTLNTNHVPDPILLRVRKLYTI